MMRRFFVLIIAITMLVSGCGCIQPSGNGARTVAASPALPQPAPTFMPIFADNNPGLVGISPLSTCPVSGDFEGVFRSPAEMVTYLECIVPAVDAWVGKTYSDMPHTPHYYLVMGGATGGYMLGCPYNDSLLQYCRTNAAIYLGIGAVWGQYYHFGDAAMPLVLAHELTHFFQQRSGITAEKMPGSKIRLENQADCGAGAFMAYARDMGYLANGDLDELGASLAAAGESDGPEREHGTTKERIDAFYVGYNSQEIPPLESCNQFVPETPLINGHQ